jgi:predicted transcriptional regulator
MGLFDDMFKQHVDKKMVPVRLGFNHVAKDIQNIHQHISHLHTNTGQWHSYLEQKAANLEKQFGQLRADIKDQVSDHVKEDMKRMQDALDSLQQSIHKESEEKVRLDERLDKLRNNIRYALEQYNKHIVQIHSRLNEDKFNEERLRELIREEIKQQVPRRIEQPKPQVIQEKSESKPVEPLKNIAYRLSNAQKHILAILSSTERRLSYRDIAAEYGKSPSTVKTILCSLRRANIPIREENDNGIKRFYLDPNYKRVIVSKQL